MAFVPKRFQVSLADVKNGKWMKRPRKMGAETYSGLDHHLLAKLSCYWSMVAFENFW